MTEPTLEYDAATRKATIEFPSGHTLRIGNIDEEKAKDFFKKNAERLQRCNCVLKTGEGFEVRSDG